MPSDQLHPERERGVLLPQAAGFGIPALAEKLLPSKRMQELYRRVQQSADGFDLENVLAAMRVDLRVEAADTARIPASGPVVVVANHPFGVLDGAALAVLLMRVRPDVKVVMNFSLEDVPEFMQHCIVMDPSTAEGDSNCRKVREAKAWLQRRDAGHLSGR
jgi:putative hemolysin